MGQMTWRAPDELIEQVRRIAGQHGWSMNEMVNRVLRAATHLESHSCRVEVAAPVAQTAQG